MAYEDVEADSEYWYPTHNSLLTKIRVWVSVKGYGNSDGASKGILGGLSDGNDKGCKDGEANGIPNAFNNGAIEGFDDSVADVALEGTPDDKALELPGGDEDF
ncbi:predicted protein [Phaeodactylum tricornutum CCAP 1055/1]|uniref:Uncharacterized protein n=2 Tax=Phaeodactylum tricornutum TaxID=2850 RepID=B7GD87_PHATC|nr:predicted protein [Phaeodactylum tricornutum CCAP 1055/1]EEC43533.1 predicted protein [Phaeodactylum tricornutum CCAP 1055/1]|eukprot:XP_002185086.1 predicted protein [Phaeodactylum tricornutum CCAP 1055/1]